MNTETQSTKYFSILMHAWKTLQTPYFSILHKKSDQKKKGQAVPQNKMNLSLHRYDVTLLLWSAIGCLILARIRSFLLSIVEAATRHAHKR